MLSIDIDGPSAVGKTTLIQQLRKEIPHSAAVDELLMQKANPYCNWKTSEEFLKKQLWFFENTLQRYTAANTASDPHTVQINDIGITDVIIHTRIFPIANALPWNVYPQFLNTVKNSCPNINLSNKLYYLYASEETLKLRRQCDTSRNRSAFESNMKLYPYQKEFYTTLMELFPDTVFCIDANSELNSLNLVTDITQAINKQANSISLSLYEILDLTAAVFSRYDI